MLTFTDKAIEMVRGYLGDAGEGAEALRISKRDGSPLSSAYDLTLVSLADQDGKDVKFEVEGIHVLVEEDSADRLNGATVDFVERVNERGFEVLPVGSAHPSDSVAPNDSVASSEVPAAAPPSGEIADRVRTILDDQVNPSIAAHGGMISLAEVKGTEIYLEMSGGCQGCALSRMTLRQGVERMIRESVPEITEVHDVTDHTSGENPYFEEQGAV